MILRSPRTSGRYPRRARTQPVVGTGADAGRYYRCWNCGFICDTQRDAQGTGRSGLHHQEYAVPSGTAYDAGLHPQPAATLDSELVSFVAVRVVPATSTVYRFKSDVQAGCPFCGTLNYTGKF